MADEENNPVSSFTSARAALGALKSQIRPRARTAMRRIRFLEDISTPSVVAGVYASTVP
jgi:hypothetical protein